MEEPLVPTHGPPIVACGLPYDGLVAMAARCVRMLSYGAIAPVLFLYCLEIGLNEFQTGVLLTCILLGDLVITFIFSIRADRIGRRKTLVVSSLLKVLAGLVFASTSNFFLLAAAGVVGVISASGGEIGPFIAVEQACLTDAVLATKGDASPAAYSGEIAVVLGWYNAVGYMSQALGALLAGVIVQQLEDGPWGMSRLEAYRCIFIAYGALGALMALLYSTLTSAAEAQLQVTDSDHQPEKATGCFRGLFEDLGLRRPETKYIVARLSVMFAMDSFGGGFTLQPWIAFWFHERWHYRIAWVGYLLMASNFVAGASGIVAAYFVQCCGPMLTMIATHLPSNILLLAVPFMPTPFSAGAMLVARFCISQMDEPARQAYIVTVVASDERSAAGGIANIFDSIGMSLAPIFVGYLSGAPPGSMLFNSPWVIAGVIKMAYDIILYSLYVCGSGLKANELAAAEKDLTERAR